MKGDHLAPSGGARSREVVRTGELVLPWRGVVAISPRSFAEMIRPDQARRVGQDEEVARTGAPRGGAGADGRVITRGQPAGILAQEPIAEEGAAGGDRAGRDGSAGQPLSADARGGVVADLRGPLHGAGRDGT